MNIPRMSSKRHLAEQERFYVPPGEYADAPGRPSVESLERRMKELGLHEGFTPQGVSVRAIGELKSKGVILTRQTRTRKGHLRLTEIEAEQLDLVTMRELMQLHQAARNTLCDWARRRKVEPVGVLGRLPAYRRSDFANFYKGRNAPMLIVAPDGRTFRSVVKACRAVGVSKTTADKRIAAAGLARTGENWAKVIFNYKPSPGRKGAFSITGFARKHGVAYTTLYSWLEKLHCSHDEQGCLIALKRVRHNQAQKARRDAA